MTASLPDQLRAILRLCLQCGLEDGALPTIQMRRLRNLNTALLGLEMILLASASYYVQIGTHGAAATMAVASLLPFVALIVLWQRHSIVIGGNLATVAALIAIMATNVVAGGIEHPSFAWYYTLPLIAGLLAGMRSGYVWLGISLACIAGTWALEQAGLFPASAIPVAEQAGQTLGEAVCIVVAIMMLMQNIVRLQRGTEDDLREMVGALQEEVEARRLAELEALEASRVKSRFLANMSHEIRTPMNGVIGMATLLEETELTEEQLEYVELLRTSGETLMTIINDILDVSKMEAGRLELAQAPFDLVEEIAGVVKLLEPGARTKGLALRTTLPSEPIKPLLGDATRFRQVVTNLLSNAIKFTDEGSVEVRVDGVFVRPSSTQLRLSIIDTGTGVSDEVQARLFTAFEQGDASLSKKHQGTGLGLMICKRLVEMMGGTIGVESREGEGATFWVRLTLPHAGDPVAESRWSDARPRTLAAG